MGFHSLAPRQLSQYRLRYLCRSDASADTGEHRVIRLHLDHSDRRRRRGGPPVAHAQAVRSILPEVVNLLATQVAGIGYVRVALFSDQHQLVGECVAAFQRVRLHRAVSQGKVQRTVDDVIDQ